MSKDISVSNPNPPEEIEIEPTSAQLEESKQSKDSKHTTIFNSVDVNENRYILPKVSISTDNADPNQDAESSVRIHSPFDFV